ncbi:MAG: ankyrin repeat domain-containing protein [Verrucomicrobia bacterium]|nr:ankyrin repeat domain-containing protein [Verrucomicrobiota bacterium]MCH8513541.1 ankyrin repeat domain-containing protein [Kiritimatiellia bacterium]
MQTKFRLYIFFFIILFGFGLYRMNRSYQNQRLLLAVYHGSSPMAESALRWGADVNHRDSPIAVSARNLLLSTTLISPRKTGKVHLYHDLIHLLLDHGANINHPDPRGYTALDYLVQTGSLHYVKEAVESGAAVNRDLSESGRGTTPLMLAAQARRLPNLFASHHDAYHRIIALLLEQGADVNAEDLNGRTALYYMAGQRRAHATVLLMLEAGARVNPERPDRGPLHLAAMNGRPSVVRELLKHGAKVDHPTGEGFTPAFLAAYANSGHETDGVEVLRILIEAGANLDLEFAGRPPIRESPLAKRALTLSEEKSSRLHLGAESPHKYTHY